MKGNHEVEVDGKIRGFRFGTYGIAVAAKKSEVSIKEFFEKLGEGDFMTMLNLFYGAAVQYADHKKQQIDFSVSDVSDWVDEMGFQKASEVMKEALQNYNPKNQNPPANPGENQISQ